MSMPYYTYQHADGTDDVAPYHCFNNYNYVAIYANQQTDYQIMLKRMDAGITPADTQRKVDNL